MNLLAAAAPYLGPPDGRAGEWQWSNNHAAYAGVLLGVVVLAKLAIDAMRSQNKEKNSEDEDR